MTVNGADLVAAGWTGTGTGTMSLGPAIDARHQVFLTSLDGKTVSYQIDHTNPEIDERETGRGVYTAAGATLTRDSGEITFSTNGGGSLVNFSPGTKVVRLVLLWRDLEEIAGGALAVLDQVDTAEIVDGAVSTEKIATGAVTGAKLEASGVSAGSYTNADITVDTKGRVTAASDGADAGYNPMVYTAVGGAAELLDGGAAGSDPMGTRRHYSEDGTVVTVIDTIPENAEWVAMREGDALTVRSVAEHEDLTAYAEGDRVWVDDGGASRIYVVAAGGGGTTGDGTPPSGTGAGITDGSVTWDYEQNGGPVTFNDEAEVTVLGVGGVAIFTRLGTTSEISVAGNIAQPAVLSPEVVGTAVRNSSDLDLDLGAAAVFDYATDGTAFADIVFLNAPAEGAVSVLLRLERSGAGAVGFASIDFGDAGAPLLGADSGDVLWVRLNRDAAGDWRGVRFLSDGAPPAIRNQIVESETLQTPASASGTLAVDLALGNQIAVTLTENVSTHTITGWPSTGRRSSVTYRFVQGASAYTVAWFAAADWGAADPPTMPAAAGAEMIVTGITDDGGTSVKMMLAWSD